MYSYVLVWLGTAAGLLTAVLWARHRERESLGDAPTVAETTEAAVDDRVSVSLDSQQQLSRRRRCLPQARGAVRRRAALVAAAVMSGAVQLDSSDPGRVMAVVQMLGQVFLLWSGVTVSAWICSTTVVKCRRCSCTSRCRCCTEPEMTVNSRVCRGVVLPVLLGGIPTLLLLALSLVLYDNSILPERIERKDLGDAGKNYQCHFVTATVVVLAVLPAWAPASRVYWSKETHDFLAAHQDALTAHKLRPVWFLRAYRWHAAAAMLLPIPFVQLSYMANELHLFADGLHTQGRTQVDAGSGKERAPISVDGVRALAPVAFVLNLGTAALGVSFGGLFVLDTKFVLDPVTPYLLAGFIGGVMIGVGVAVLVATFTLMHALSEPRAERDGTAAAEETEEANPRSELLRTTLTLPVSSTEQRRWRLAVARVTKWAGSWEGQTQLSIANHLSTIATLVWGIVGENLSGTLIALLWVAVSLSTFGIFVSVVSLCGRRCPHQKILPSDDSFRATCVLKTSLVMIKAFIVFELSDVDAAPTWESIVTMVFFTSFFVMALMTLALAVPKIWKHPHLLEAVGIESPRVFLVQYVMSYVATKLGVLLLMLAGRLPDLFQGCASSFVVFTYEYESQELCFNDPYATCDPVKWATNWTNWPHGNCPAPSPTAVVCHTIAGDCHGDKYTYNCGTGSSLTSGQTCYGCSSCRAEFFSQDTLAPILLTLFWLPFAVYSNNETAQLIDGLWWQHLESRGSTGSNQRRVGLSTAQHGAMAVAPLVQVVVMGCVALSLWPSWFMSRVAYDLPGSDGTEVPGEYNPSGYPLPQLAPQDDFTTFAFNGWPQGLRWSILLGVLFVNVIMLVRALLNCHGRCVAAKAQRASASINDGGDSATPLLSGPGGSE